MSDAEWVCKHCGGDNFWQNFEVQSSGWKYVTISEVDDKPSATATGSLEQNYDSDSDPADYECDCGASAWDIADLLVRAYDKCPTCNERADEPNEFCSDHRPLDKPRPGQITMDT